MMGFGSYLDLLGGNQFLEIVRYLNVVMVIKEEVAGLYLKVVSSSKREDGIDIQVRK